MYIYAAESTSLLFSNLATQFKPSISQLVLTKHIFRPMSTAGNQTATASATGSTPSATTATNQSHQDRASQWQCSKTFVRGTEQNFGLRTGGCRFALNPTHAALHTRYFRKVTVSLNQEKGIDNEHDLTTCLDTILKTHNKQYPKVCISKIDCGMDDRSEFWAQLDACDTENDILLEIKMQFKERKGLQAAKAAACND